METSHRHLWVIVCSPFQCVCACQAILRFNPSSHSLVDLFGDHDWSSLLINNQWLYVASLSHKECDITSLYYYVDYLLK